MTMLARWEPLREMASITERMNRLFDELWRRPLVPRAFEEDVLAGAWVPAVDVRETRDALELAVELPGIDPKDVEVTVDNGVLTVRGERKAEREEEGTTYHRRERVWGAFERSFTLPGSVDPDKLKATYRHGLLTITVPKREEAKPKAIKIAVEGK